MKFYSNDAIFPVRIIAFAIALGFLALILFFTPTPVVRAAPKATMTVQSAGDGIQTPGNCPGVNCRLRDAIAAAGIGDTINFSLTLPATITLISGTLSFSDRNISGPGANLLTVSGNNAAGVFGTSGNVTISGLTIREGNAGATNYGGGIFLGSGVLTLTNVSVISNTAALGGGIWNDGVTLILISTTVANNLAPHGGGIYNNNSSSKMTMSNSIVTGNIVTGIGGGIVNGGTMTMTSSTLSQNQSGDNGGGIWNGSAGVIAISGSNLYSNTAPSKSGGAIHNDGYVQIDASVIRSNFASLVGGGIENNGTLTITSSTISSNVISTTFASGGGLYNNKTLTITNTTINNNMALGSSPNGGGIFQETPASVLTLNNVTMSGNTSTGVAGAIDVVGGTANLNNVTITRNSAAGSSGGVYASVPTFNFRNTILAGNTASTGPDCVAVSALNSQDYNLIGDSSGCTISGTTTHNVTGDPKLTPLAYLGGPTQVHGILSGSPALNGGNNSNCLSTDQRGVTRPLTGGNPCDIGAFEGIASALYLPLILR